MDRYAAASERLEQAVSDHDRLVIAFDLLRASLATYTDSGDRETRQRRRPRANEIRRRATAALLDLEHELWQR